MMKKRNYKDLDDHKPLKKDVFYITIGSLKLPIRYQDLGFIKWGVLILVVVGGLATIFKEINTQPDPKPDPKPTPITPDSICHITTDSIRQDSLQNAVRFENAYIEVKPIDLNLLNATYEAFVKFDTLQNGTFIMGNPRLYSLKVSQDENNDYNFQVTFNEYNSSYRITDKTTLKTHHWYHVAFTHQTEIGKNNKVKELTKAKLYVDSASTSTTWNNGRNTSNSSRSYFYSKESEPFYIAQYKKGTNSVAFQGYLSEVRVWNTARTKQEILDHAFSVNPTSPHLQIYYKLKDIDLEQEDFVPNSNNRQPKGTIKMIESE